jgi:uracil-DNA glycosylase
MNGLFKQIENCRKCKTIIGYSKFPIESHGNLDPFAILVSEAPGKDSLDKKKYWVGAGGKILRECLPYETDLEDLFYLTDIVKCWPNENSENRKPLEVEIENCSHFLVKEINLLKPKVILSFGGTSSSFLLKREVRITKEHGKVSQYNPDTKIITLLHPSGIDRFMDRRVYKIQLGLLFVRIKNSDLDNIDEIFTEENTIEIPRSKSSHTSTKENFKQIDKGSFIIPSAGNSITQGDVNKSQIRITVDFKEFFPAKSSEIFIEYKQEIFQIKYTYRFNKSHILRLGSDLATRIKLKPGMKVKMTVLDKNKFRIE